MKRKWDLDKPHKMLIHDISISWEMIHRVFPSTHADWINEEKGR